MKIDDYYELYALQKLLAKIKFEQNFDFYDLLEFANSPLIAEIYKRVHEEYWKESIKRGFIQEGKELQFEFESSTGEILKLRIDELSKLEFDTLISNESINDYLSVLIIPYSASDEEFLKLRNYFLERSKQINL